MHTQTHTHIHPGNPRTDRAAAIRQSVGLYAMALGLSAEHTAECEQIAVDNYEAGDSAAWAISVAKARAQELSRGES